MKGKLKMPPQALIILEIVKLSLEITLKIIEGIPVESRQKIWLEHEARMKFWQDLLQPLK